MKILATLLLCGAVAAPGVFAAEVGGALPSGTPAGVKQAQVEGSTVPWLWIGLGVAAVVIGVASTSGGSKTVTSTSTGSP